MLEPLEGCSPLLLTCASPCPAVTHKEQPVPAPLGSAGFTCSEEKHLKVTSV